MTFCYQFIYVYQTFLPAKFKNKSIQIRMFNVYTSKLKNQNIYCLFQGKTYCIWKLSDLQDCDKSISFFLFGEVYKQHWKNEVTAVVGILNPNLMDKAEKVGTQP